MKFDEPGNLAEIGLSRVAQRVSNACSEPSLHLELFIAINIKHSPMWPRRSSVPVELGGNAKLNGQQNSAAIAALF